MLYFKKRIRITMEVIMAKCPKCKEDIADGAKKCKHCGSDLRNWFARHKFLTGFLGLVVLIIIIASFGGSKDSNSNSSSSSGSQPAKTEEAKKFNIDDIYAKIETGMSEDQVKEIVTKDPINCTESEMQGLGTSKLCSYGNVFTDAGSIMVTYNNGKVFSKTKSQY
jgi:hypothetical protein